MKKFNKSASKGSLKTVSMRPLEISKGKTVNDEDIEQINSILMNK